MGNNPINNIDPTGHTELWVDGDFISDVDYDDDAGRTYFEGTDTGVRDYYESRAYTVDWVNGTVVVTSGGGSSSSDSDGGGGSSYHEPTKAERRASFAGVVGQPSVSVKPPNVKTKIVPPSTQAVENKVTDKITKTISPSPIRSEKNQKVEKTVEQIHLLSLNPSTLYQIPKTERERKRILYEGTLTEEQAK